MLAQALEHDAVGEGAAAAELRRQALELAEPTAGTIDGQAFAWIMDADPRLGPVLEVIVNGTYRWLPFLPPARAARRSAQGHAGSRLAAC